MTSFQVGLGSGREFPTVKPHNLLIPFIEEPPIRGYWRPEFISDYFSTRRLTVTRWLNWWINDIVDRARLEEQEAIRLAEGMQVVLWRDPAPIDEWINVVSIRPVSQVDAALEPSRRPVPFCGEVPGTLRLGLRSAVFSKTCSCAVRVAVDSLERKDGRFDVKPPFLALQGQESLVYRGLIFFPEPDVHYMWGDEYRSTRDIFLSEMYGIDLRAEEF